MISVVMCAYNAQQYLPAAIESLLAQTMRDFELIVVDDGSTDGTASLVRGYARRDGRVRLLTGEHQGIGASANRGIAAARYPWIARADADDVSLPHRFARQLAAAALEPGVVLWGAYALHVNDAGQILGLSRTGPTTVAQFHMLRGRGEDAYVLQPTWLVRRDAVLAAGGYGTRYDGCEDLELLDRLADHGPALTIPEPLVLYRIHSSSISMQRFAAVRHVIDFVRMRRSARLAGRSLEFDDFERIAAERPPLTRARIGLANASAFAYRNAGVAYASGRAWAAAVWLARSAACNPVYPSRRIWHQVFSAGARRLRGEQAAAIAAQRYVMSGATEP